METLLVSYRIQYDLKALTIDSDSKGFNETLYLKRSLKGDMLTLVR